MIRFLIISVILFAINACSYEPLLSSKNYDFELIIKSTAGNENVNKIIVKELKKKSVGNKKYSVEFSSEIDKQIVSSNEQGDPIIYRLEINTDFKISKDGKNILKNKISKQSNYNNIDDKFELDKYEDKILENLSKNISSEILNTVKMIK